jgi:hypothetical protein
MEKAATVIVKLNIIDIGNQDISTFKNVFLFTDVQSTIVIDP